MKPLSKKHQKHLASEVAGILSHLRQTPSPSHEKWLRHQLDTLLWFWSVDGEKGGRVVRDGLAPKPSSLDERHLALNFHTEAAAAQLGMEKPRVRRDHAVPKKVLVQLLRDARDEQIGAMLKRYCVVVLVHVDEDEGLSANKLRAKMPVGWDSESLLKRDPWARYKACRINVFGPSGNAVWT